MRKETSLRSLNPQTYTQSHTPHRGTRGGGWNPSPEFLICCSISKRFYLKWKVFHLLNKMRYILWVVALLEACVVAILAAILDFTKN